MNQFYCKTGKNIFEAVGVKEKYTSVIYGPCWKFVAPCPDCGATCNEQRQVESRRKGGFYFDSYVENLRSQGGGCNPGGGCCGS